jgi:hypothetical protein
MVTYFLIGLTLLLFVIFLRKKKIVFLILTLLTLFASCYDNRPPEMTTFTLTDGRREQKLRIFSTYYADQNYNEKTKDYYVIVNCVYPSMVPRHRGESALPPGHIRLMIEIGGVSDAEFFINQYKNSKPPYRSTDSRLTGKDGSFDVYTKKLMPSGDIESMKIKKDSNGYLLSLNDASPLFANYGVTRRLDKDIHIFYQYDKGIKDNFEKVDSKVVDLVKSFMTP